MLAWAEFFKYGKYQKEDPALLRDVQMNDNSIPTLITRKSIRDPHTLAIWFPQISSVAIIPHIKYRKSPSTFWHPNVLQPTPPSLWMRLLLLRRSPGTSQLNQRSCTPSIQHRRTRWPQSLPQTSAQPSQRWTSSLEEDYSIRGTTVRCILFSFFLGTIADCTTCRIRFRFSQTFPTD